MEIDRIKLSTNRWTTELEEDIDPTKRTILSTEVEVYETATRPTGDGHEDIIYKAKVCGATYIKQGAEMPQIKGSSKLSHSQRLRRRMYVEVPEDEYYETQMNKLIANWNEVAEFIKNL